MRLQRCYEPLVRLSRRVAPPRRFEPTPSAGSHGRGTGLAHIAPRRDADDCSSGVACRSAARVPLRRARAAPPRACRSADVVPAPPRGRAPAPRVPFRRAVVLARRVSPACGSARSRPSACAPASPAKRTTTIPPGSTPVTTPSPKVAWTTSSPMRNDRAGASSLRGPRRWPPPRPPRTRRARSPGRPARDARRLVGQLARDLVEEARATPKARAPPNEVAPPREGQVEVAHRPRDADVGEPALLLDVALVDRARGAGTRRPPCRS